jgi:hypothetical protein
VSNIDCSMTASNLAIILPVGLRIISLTAFMKGGGTGQTRQPNFGFFEPAIYQRTLMGGSSISFLTTSQHYLLYPPVVSISSTCERLYNPLRCIINRGSFVESFAVRLATTSRRPNLSTRPSQFSSGAAFLTFFFISACRFGHA